jgi:hypothetical protein
MRPASLAQRSADQRQGPPGRPDLPRSERRGETDRQTGRTLYTTHHARTNEARQTDRRTDPSVRIAAALACSTFLQSKPRIQPAQHESLVRCLCPATSGRATAEMRHALEGLFLQSSHRFPEKSACPHKAPLLVAMPTLTCQLQQLPLLASCHTTTFTRQLPH